MCIAVIYVLSWVGLFVTFHPTSLWSDEDDRALREWAARHPQTGQSPAS